MGLDVRVKVQRKIICKHCGEVAATEIIDEMQSNGIGWYELLEQFNYYVPYDKRIEGQPDWYGKDMLLSEDTVKELVKFLNKHTEINNSFVILGEIASALYNGHNIVINADW